MRRLALALALVSGTLLSTGLIAQDKKHESKKAPARLQLGAAAPAGKTEMEGVDGKKYTIDGVAGKAGTLVIFSCNHCPYAKAWAGRIAALGNEYAKKGFGVLVVNSNDIAVHADDSMDKMKDESKRLKLEFPYVMDSDSSVARAFGATKTPEVFLFDKDKKLVYWGAVDDNSDDEKAVKQHYLKDALDAVVAGKKPEPAETKALGCGISFRPEAPEKKGS